MSEYVFSPRIGFIGAGKAGTSLGKLFVDNGQKVAGYYSRTPESARYAASFTDTLYYESIEKLINDCDMIFLTVPDSAIREVWSFVSECDISGRIICHCSGSMASHVFSGHNDPSVSYYSIHPMYAISSRETGYVGLGDAVFSIEGSENRLDEITNWLKSFINNVATILADNKTLYHAAAVFASNLVTGLYFDACKLLSECGFSDEQAQLALGKLFEGNCKNVLEKGPVDALTGPVERNDVKTIREHIMKLKESAQKEAVGDSGQITSYENLLETYRSLSRSLVEIGSIKHPEYDYTDILDILNNQ